MTLTTAQQVRLRIQDQPVIMDHVGTADGQAKEFALPMRAIQSATAYIHDSNQQWTATGATVDATGFVAFSAVITANSAWRVRGVASTFSDDEIGHFTAVGGSVPGAALEAVKVLMFDSLKRASWAAPDGTNYDDTKAMDQLNTLYEQLQAEVSEGAIQYGGFVSWAMGQTGL